MQLYKRSFEEVAIALVSWISAWDGAFATKKNIFHKDHFLSLGFVYSWDEKFHFWFINDLLFYTWCLNVSLCTWIVKDAGFLLECLYLVINIVFYRNQSQNFLVFFPNTSVKELEISFFSSWSEWRRDLILFFLSRNVFLHKYCSMT